MTWRCGLAAVTLLAIVSTAHAETPGQVTEYALPAGSAPQAIANGPGGMWITLQGTNSVARMTTAGGVTVFGIPTANSGVNEITPGPDGNVWFTESAASKIGRITPDGVITEFPTPTASSVPTGITPGPDGNVWFTEASTPTARIGRITAAGVISEFAVPGNEALGIITGPDGNLWYSAPNGNRVGQMNPSTQAATEFFAPGNPTSLAVADNTSIWYTQQTGNGIGHITTAGTTTPGGKTDNSSDAIVHSDDGSSWFTLANGKVGNITPAAAVTEYQTPSALPDHPTGMTQGPDLAIWVPEPTSARIARVSTNLSSPAIAPPAQGRTIAGATVSGTVRVKRPGSKTFVTLGAGQDLPVGTIVDTRSGTVELTATSGGVAYAAKFFEGQFQLAQAKARGAPADLKLFGGSFKGCPGGVRVAAKKSVRHLWAEGGGKFRTVGRYSSATIRGTKWLTDDQCAGTLTKVLAGKVLVRDFVRRRNVIVRAHGQYFAAARGR